MGVAHAFSFTVTCVFLDTGCDPFSVFFVVHFECSLYVQYCSFIKNVHSVLTFACGGAIIPASKQ